MKRVKAVCICQTLHFMQKEDVGHDYAQSHQTVQFQSGRQLSGLAYRKNKKRVAYGVIPATGAARFFCFINI